MTAICLGNFLIFQKAVRSMRSHLGAAVDPGPSCLRISWCVHCSWHSICRRISLADRVTERTHSQRFDVPRTFQMYRLHLLVAAMSAPVHRMLMISDSLIVQWPITALCAHQHNKGDDGRWALVLWHSPSPIIPIIQLLGERAAYAICVHVCSVHIFSA